MPTKHAVLIGIDKYPLYSSESQLRGCVNDTRLMRSVLVEHFRFDPANIRMLHDRDATRANILGAMEHLVEIAQDGDIVVFHYSGHGRQRVAKLRTNTALRPTDGEWFDASEGTHRDSTLQPSDTGPPDHPHLDITDNTIHNWLARLTQKTPHVTLIFDACHSGTIARDTFGGTDRTGPVEMRPLEEPEAVVGERIDPHRKGKSGWLEKSERYVVISGCQDNQRSKERSFGEGDGAERHGVLTWHLAQALMRATPGTTYRDVFDVVRREVMAMFKTQHPQIEGRVDRELFGTRDIEPMRFVSVGTVSGATITLEGGAAHGLQRDSLWDIYPPGTKQTEGLAPVASARIDKVGALESTGTLVEAGTTVEPGSRAVVRVAVGRSSALVVDLSTVPSAEREVLAQVTDQSGLLREAASPDEAHIRACVVGPRTHAAATDPLPDVPVIAQRSWALIDEDARMTLPLHPVDEDGVIDILQHNLETRARFQNTLHLENPVTRLDVEVDIFKRAADGSLPEGNANAGDTVFEEGEHLVFHLLNFGSDPVWYCILELAPNGAISPIWPPPGRTSEFISAQRDVKVGLHPINIAMTRQPADPDLAVYTYKVFFASAQTSFEWQQQAGFRSDGGEDTGLSEAMAAASEGASVRTARDSDDDWCAVTRTVLVRRPGH